MYLPSTTIAPSSDVTFRRPIVAAEFSQQGQSDISNSINRNRFLNNQAKFVYGNSNGAVLVNQANSQVTTNRGIVRNQEKFSNNRATGAFASSRGNLANNQNTPTRTLIGSSVITGGTSDFNNNLVRQNNGNFGRLQSSTSQPEVTTYSGSFSKTKNRNDYEQNKKVIVKLSDLHPLILEKLGAECICKADPFAVFRGPNRQTLPIDSKNRGRVDLANYDEGDIYVDVDVSDKEKDIEFLRNIPSSRLIKTDNRYNNGAAALTSVRSSSSTTYLPPKRPSSSTTYLPPTSITDDFTSVLGENEAQSKLTRNRPLLIRVEDDNNNRFILTQRQRSGKSLSNGSKDNNLKKSVDEIIEDEPDCARQGLFRHPKFCNKFYACHWDNWKKRFTLHVLNCPIHLAFDSSAGACNYPMKGPACQDNKLLI